MLGLVAEEVAVRELLSEALMPAIGMGDVVAAFNVLYLLGEVVAPYPDRESLRDAHWVVGTVAPRYAPHPQPR